jgi:hypothetical protein
VAEILRSKQCEKSQGLIAELAERSFEIEGANFRDSLILLECKHQGCFSDLLKAAESSSSVGRGFELDELELDGLGRFGRGVSDA